MSRTEKDDPDWVKGIKDPHHTISHDPKCEEYPGIRYGRNRPPVEACDVDKANWSGRQVYDHCHYVPRRGTRSSMYEWFGQTCSPHWYRHHIFENPKRTEERVKLRKATQQYNGSGDTDD